MLYRTTILFMNMFFVSCDGQRADLDADVTVKNPMFSSSGPTVLFDEGHRNFHTAEGNFAPFVRLIRNDGYVVRVHSGLFTRESLTSGDILVVVNARGEEKKFDPAFTDAECDAVEQWVRNGGSLLLIADHHPMGRASAGLAEKFGVRFHGGFTNDSVYFDSTSFTASQVDGKSQLVFSRANGLLGDHPILNGRDETERVERIISFTGQSMRGPEGSGSILTLSPHATEVIPDSIWEEPDMIFFTNTYTRFGDPLSVAGASQAVAFEYGNGRVVMLGEAAMITAQKAGEERFGIQSPGHDGRHLALNIMRWLARAL